MRVSTVAEIAGVSVRTIRHYHQIGLLPIPPQRGAWRNYSFEDVALLVRIRTLTTAGIPLAEVPRHLQEASREIPSDDVGALDDAIESLTSRIDSLEAQRQRLLALREQVAAGKQSFLPDALAESYDEIVARIRASGSTKALRLFRRERMLVELAAQRGFIDDDFSYYLSRVNHQEVADFYVEFADPTGGILTEPLCAQLVDRLFAILESYGDPPPSTIENARRLANNRAVRLLCLSAAPSAGHRRFVNMAFDRLKTDL
ncbi:MerR family transcriptional regulator [Corynebacterium sp.]|uniref:MerR family transcriptional regulator n=1 Tax=Corynebacterium sp. TaxID=1720 RepID=UPI0026DCFB67|nr:MerR family transcriptional regulator [Corynebacterium sp.]MDO5077074.1 MerR family transcriptional regulator [Corynebacterium sp.]